MRLRRTQTKHEERAGEGAPDSLLAQCGALGHFTGFHWFAVDSMAWRKPVSSRATVADLSELGSLWQMGFTHRLGGNSSRTLLVVSSDGIAERL